ncbi:uncharacterized protein [Eurosta solidaginis]|uniref:uncharacterized protein n=1 Tax=Eurosta solidaginis TaxID=178769 RepID=UPI003530A260
MWVQFACIVVLGLGVNLDSCRAELKRYDNYGVYLLQPSSQEHLDAIKKFYGSIESFHFLNRPRKVNDKCHVLVAPDRISNFTATLEQAKVSYTLVEANAQKNLEVKDLAADIKEKYNWERYHQLNHTYDWLRALVKAYPNQVSLIVAGKSYEGRDILGVRISYDNSNTASGKRRSIFIEGGLHAREWISPAVTTYIINQLLTSSDKRVRKIAESHVWYVVPHINPDGFVRTYTTDRLWRKNAKPYGKCFGVDINRNFDFHWDEIGASNDPCEEDYAGPKPFSEIETQTLSEYINKIKDELVLYLSFHSYSQVLIFPYGYTNARPATYTNLKRVSDVAVAAISKRYGTQYVGGIAYEVEYPDSGTSTDWAYGEINIPYVYCYELRPLGNVTWDGFVLPANKIIPTGEETMDSVIAMIEEISKLVQLVYYEVHNMWAKLNLIFLIGLTVHLECGHAQLKRYDNHIVYEVQPSSQEELNALGKIDSSESVIFLNPVRKVGTKINVIVAPNQVTNFTAALDQSKVSYTLIDNNAQNKLALKDLVMDVNEKYGWNQYHQLDSTYAWLRGLPKIYPKQVSLFVAGKTFDGRDILGVRISYDNINTTTGKRRSIFIEGGIHAREWISPAITTYIINQLLTSTDKRVRQIAESHVWYAVPHTNPDGYVRTYTTDRLWRKTAKPYGKCFGADMNRNWDFHWDVIGASNDPCEEEYAGPKPFSEIETQTLSQYITKIKDELVLYLSFHSYSQVLIFPYGYTNAKPATYTNLKRVSDVAVAAISKRYGTKYVGGIAYDVEYPDSGTSTDWAYGKLNIPYVYCYELRPLGNVTWDGFALPANQIIPTGEETMDSVLAMIGEINVLEK